MEEKKRSKKEIREQTDRDAENMPSVRRLRELVERGMAELEARSGKTKRKKTKEEIREERQRKAEDSPIVRQLRELYARGMAELETRRKAEQQG